MGSLIQRCVSARRYREVSDAGIEDGKLDLARVARSSRWQVARIFGSLPLPGCSSSSRVLLWWVPHATHHPSLRSPSRKLPVAYAFFRAETKRPLSIMDAHLAIYTRHANSQTSETSKPPQPIHIRHADATRDVAGHAVLVRRPISTGSRTCGRRYRQRSCSKAGDTGTPIRS